MRHKKKHQRHYYSHDALGSIRSLTSDAGVILNRQDYTSFGEPYSWTNELVQRYGFTGRESTDIPGTMYYRHRQYCPYAGKFEGRDPAGYRHNKNGNLYSYQGESTTYSV